MITNTNQLPFGLQLRDRNKAICCQWVFRVLLLAMVSLVSSPTFASTWTEGAKKVLFIRVDFSDKPGDPVSEATAKALIDTTVNNSYVENSYGKTSMTAVVTPTLRMPQTSS